MRSVAVLGATGSIGVQALDVIARSPDLEVVALSAHRDVEGLVAAARATGVRHVALVDPSAADRAARELDGVVVLCGEGGVEDVIAASGADLVLNAIVGAAGLRATLAAFAAGADVALANKESLVAGGELVLAAAHTSGRRLLPVDSEHSALAQCLEGAEPGAVTGLVITASGGPFRGRRRDELGDVTAADALAHPTWSMGQKITIDSATLMNKGLEVIEAHHLFGVPYDAIEVVVHPQSIVHGMVRFRDGALLAHAGVPDMRVPISWALTHPASRADRGRAARPLRTSQPRVRAARSRHVPLPRPRPRGRCGRRHRAVRAQRRERGGGARLPRRPHRLPRHRGRRGGRARPGAAGARRVARAGARRRPQGAFGRSRRRGRGRMSVAIAIGGLLLLVAVHELGHFAAAKATGMRALRFYLGFPPAILKRRFGDTEYGIGAIPLGGFVKIPGMLRPEPGDLYEVDDLLDRSESLSEDEATAIGVALDDVRRNLTQGKYDDALAGLPGLRAAVDRADASLSDAERRRVTRSMDRLEENLDPRAYWRCSRARRLVVITAGPAANVLACFVILWGVAIHGRPDGTMLTHDVAAVIAGSPADHAGLKPGDRLVGINGRVLPPLQVRDAIERSHGNPITVTVDRHGHDVVLGPVRTKVIDGTYRLGFSFQAGLKTYSFLEAPVASASFMWQLTTGTASALANVVTPQGRSQLHSTVGIVRYSADAADAGTPFYLTLLAYISLSLAIFNLLPFLPLDGGHVFMIALERLRGRMVSRAVFERISVLGIALMVLVFLIGLQNDLAGILSPSAR